VLWDIDHTLIENNGVNKETYAEAFELLTGRRAAHRAETDGRTEPEIMRNMLAAHAIDVPDGFPARVIMALETVTLANAPRLRERGHELPGARETLAAFQDLPCIVRSVLSGNTKSNALTKLSAFGLHGYLDLEVGGYGSDDDVRVKLVRVAQLRASEKYGHEFGPDSTVLIGDTPRDVRTGLEGGLMVWAWLRGPAAWMSCCWRARTLPCLIFVILRRWWMLSCGFSGRRGEKPGCFHGGCALLPEPGFLDRG